MQNISKHVTKKALAKGHLTEHEVDTLLDDYIHGAKQQYRGDVMAAVIDKFLSQLPDISNNADSCQALFEDTSFFLPERGFLFRFLSFSLFSASTTTARL
jgi:hypothetical protein